MLNTTAFNTSKHHIDLEGQLTFDQATYDFIGILDTGAPRTEFSLQFLLNSGILNQRALNSKNLNLKQATQKIGKLNIPVLEVCEQAMMETEVFISIFDSSWAVDALIGLDFFRKFKTCIDYSKGAIETESFIQLNY